MINEKYKWPISIVSIILSFIFMISLIRFNTNPKNQSMNNKKLETVLDKESVMDVNIKISDENWNWLIENAQQEEYRNADITINGETFYNVGIRPKGNSTLTTVANDDTTDRFSFKVKFDEYVSDQTYHGMKSIVLNNIIQDLTYMKEYISYDLCNFMGIATPEMQYSNIKINDKDWGLYLAIEVIDERYLENNFGTNEGNLYKPETMGMDRGNGGPGGMGGPGGNPPEGGIENMPGGPGNPLEGFDKAALEDMNNGDINKENNTDQPQIDGDNQEQEGENPMGSGGNGGPGGMGDPNSGRSMAGADFKYIDDNISSYSTVRDSAVFKRTTDKDFKKVINMFKNLNDGTNLEEVLDVEEVLKYFAINTYLANFDSYSGAMYHNYYLYEKDGKCQILPWDFNLSFGGFSKGGPGGPGGNKDNNTSGENNIINFPIDKVVTGDLEDAPLIGKLLEVDEYKELYHSYLEQIAEDYFNNNESAILYVEQGETLLSLPSLLNIVYSFFTLLNNTNVPLSPLNSCDKSTYSTLELIFLNFPSPKGLLILKKVVVINKVTINNKNPKNLYLILSLENIAIFLILFFTFFFVPLILSTIALCLFNEITSSTLMIVLPYPCTFSSFKTLKTFSSHDNSISLINVALAIQIKGLNQYIQQNIIVINLTIISFLFK